MAEGDGEEGEEYRAERLPKGWAEEEAEAVKFSVGGLLYVFLYLH